MMEGHGLMGILGKDDHGHCLPLYHNENILHLPRVLYIMRTLIFIRKKGDSHTQIQTPLQNNNKEREREREPYLDWK